MRIPARIIFVATFVLILFSTISLPVFAQTTNAPAAAPLQIIPPVDNNVPMTIGNLSQGILWGMFSFMSCAVDGIDVASPNQACLGYNPQTHRLGYVTGQGGLIGMTTSGIAMLYSPPQIHVGSFLSYLGNNFGLVKKTYAATGPQTGFDQLAPITKLWLTFRNVTYVLFVIVFVVVGFAIMLRAKIDPRTVMTIENQIPKLIVALLLVSFSYAIAGFVIDIMWLVTFVTINLFGSMDSNIQTAVVTYNASVNPLAMLNALSSGGLLGIILQPAASVYDILVPITKRIIDGFPILAVPGILPCVIQGIASFFANPIGSTAQTVANSNIPVISGLFGFFTGGTNTAAGIDWGKCVTDGAIAMYAGVAGLVAFLIFAFALFFALIKVYFTLLKSYALFILYAILGPFFIMLGALPDTKINFDNWIRHLLAYSLVFPYALGILLLGRVVSDAYTGAPGFAPPLIGVSQSTTASLGPLIGFSIILLLPQALTMLQDALKAPDIKYLPGVGQMMAAGTSAYTTVVSKPWQRLTRKENKMEGKSEGELRRWALGAPGSFRRRLLGDTTGK